MLATNYEKIREVYLNPPKKFAKIAKETIKKSFILVHPYT